MPTGSCMCGNIKISYEGEPKFTALCHCLDDRKMTNVMVFQIPEVNFKVLSGVPKVWTKKSNFDRDINTHFCDTCGTQLFRTGGAPEVAGCVGIRAGVLDDPSIVEETSPRIEVFTERRPKWMKRVDGAMQLNSQYDLVEEGNV